MVVLCGMPTIHCSARRAFLVRIVQVRGMTLNTTVKTETRHPAERSFGSEFPAICNRCGVMAAGSLKTPKRRKVN